MNKTGDFRTVRLRDFHPYHMERGPVAASAAIFSYNTELREAKKALRWHPVPTKITSTTPLPLQLHQALQYQDGTEWARAHDEELYQLDRTNTILCLPPHIKPPSKLLPITTGYRCKWTTGFQLLKLKARGALRGYLMIAFLQIDSDHRTAAMASASSFRLLFALKAMYNLHM